MDEDDDFELGVDPGPIQWAEGEQDAILDAMGAPKMRHIKYFTANLDEKTKVYLSLTPMETYDPPAKVEVVQIVGQGEVLVFDVNFERLFDIQPE